MSDIDTETAISTVNAMVGFMDELSPACANEMGSYVIDCINQLEVEIERLQVESECKELNELARAVYFDIHVSELSGKPKHIVDIWEYAQKRYPPHQGVIDNE